MEKILVTGANGFLATNTISKLLDDGYGIIGILRNRSSFIGERHPNLTLIEGDFTDNDFISKHLGNCDHVVHIAAMTGQTGKKEEYYRVNTEATVRLAEAAADAGIKRMIYVCTANAFAYGTYDDPGNEDKPTKWPFTESDYAMSKALAQKELQKLTDRIEIITVNPTFMLGPMDIKPSSGRIITMGYGRRVMAAPPGGKNFVHVGDVSKGISAALKKGRNGEAYLLCGENMDYYSFYKLLASISGKGMAVIRLPEWLMMTIGRICSMLYRIGIKTDATIANMRLLCIGNYYSNTKAVRELGIEFRSAEESVTDAVTWFKEQGML